MGKAIVRRRLLVAITIVAGGFIFAALVRYAPGFGMDERQLDPRLSNESIEAIRNSAVEERSLVRLYFGSLRRILRGDLGTSQNLQRPVRQLLAERITVTLEVVGKGLGAAWLAAVLLVLATWAIRSPVLEAACEISAGTLLCLPAGGLA
jgi:peptide/nickel transport system permease protein